MKNGRLSFLSTFGAVVLFVSLTGSYSLAQTSASWNDAQGTWDTSADWNCPTSATHCVPNNSGATTYDVTIGTSNGVVNLFSSPAPGVTVDSISIGSGNNLTVFGSSSLTVTGNMDNAGIYTQFAAPVTVDGTFTNESGAGLNLSGTSGAGMLTVGNLKNSGFMDISSNTTLKVNSGGTYEQTGASAITALVGGTLISPSVDIAGGLLSGSGTIDGDVTMSGGTMAAAAGNLGMRPPYFPGELTVDGNLDFDGGTLAEVINADNSFGVLNVSNTLSLAGGDPLNILLGSGYTPAVGTTFEFLTASSLTDPNGLFTILDPEINDNEFWTLYTSSDNLFLKATSRTAPTPEPASLLLLGTGSLGLAYFVRRREKRAATA